MSRIFLRWFTFSLVWSLASFPSLLAEANGVQLRGGIAIQAGSEFPVTVYVYNSADISSRDLIDAEARAARIFRKAGIEVTWVGGLMARDIQDLAMLDEQRTGARLHLRIWTRSMARPKTIGTDTLGFCLSIERGLAVVLADEVQNLAASRSADPADLLGLAMAHEMGHLLLRSEAHSAAGIMQARWLQKDLRDGEEGLLVFTREQGQLMRTEVRRRTGQPTAREAGTRLTPADEGTSTTAR